MSTTTGTPVRRSAAALGLSAALAAGALAPTAGADPLDATGAQNCIVITELARELCAPLGEDLDRKVLEETGLTVVDSTTAPAASRSSSPASAAATYVLARLYDDADYGGLALDHRLLRLQRHHREAHHRHRLRLVRTRQLLRRLQRLHREDLRDHRLRREQLRLRGQHELRRLRHERQDPVPPREVRRRRSRAT